MHVRHRARALVAALVLVGLTPAAALPAAASAQSFVPLVLSAGRAGTSSNWSGYASTSGPFTRVSATWVQPPATCGAGASYSAFWVGLDGDGSNTVEQIGSEVDCHSGAPVYYAWFEMYPKAGVNLTKVVAPGDTLSASVAASTAGVFQLTISDVTRGWSVTKTKTKANAKRFSAEIIAEAPSDANGTLPLANFGSVSFSNAQANGAPIGNAAPEDIIMASGSITKATPSALSGGQSFTITWNHA